MKILVIFKSKTGFAKKYAEELVNYLLDTSN